MGSQRVSAAAGCLQHCSATAATACTADPVLTAWELLLPPLMSSPNDRSELTRVSCTPSFLGRKACVPNRHDPNIKAKAIRLVREHRGDYPSEFAAIKVVAGAESAQGRELKRKSRELEQTIEILKAATGFFAREYDPRQS